MCVAAFTHNIIIIRVLLYFVLLVKIIIKGSLLCYDIRMCPVLCFCDVLFLLQHVSYLPCQRRCCVIFNSLKLFAIFDCIVFNLYRIESIIVDASCQ